MTHLVTGRPIGRTCENILRDTIGMVCRCFGHVATISMPKNATEVISEFKSLVGNPRSPTLHKPLFGPPSFSSLPQSKPRSLVCRICGRDGRSENYHLPDQWHEMIPGRQAVIN